jgi:hypothetical protein
VLELDFWAIKFCFSLDVLCGCHLPRCSYNIHYFLWLDKEFFIILYNILKNCCVSLLSKYNIKHTCTIYTLLELDFWAIKFCFSLDGIWAHTIDTLQHQSLSLMSSALHHSATSAILKYSFNSRSVTLSLWFNFLTYIIFSINLVSQVALRSSGTGILYGCHLLRCLYNILYFLLLYDDFFIIPYNILKIAN